MAKNESHQFYCLLCGKPGIPLQRRVGFQHGAFHRKKMWCPNCKMEVNHVEIKTLDEKEKFLEDFENGVYKDEAEKSRDFLRDSRVG